MTRADAGFEGPLPGLVDKALANQEIVFKDSFPGMLGVRIVEAGAGHAVGTLTFGPAVRHPGGYAHGGALAGFGDSVAAWATFPGLAEGESFTTIEFKANFLTGVRGGRLRAEANAVHRGRRTMVLEVKIETDEVSPKLVALMLVTQAILPGAGTEEAPES